MTNSGTPPPSYRALKLLELSFIYGNTLDSTPKHVLGSQNSLSEMPSFCINATEHELNCSQIINKWHYTILPVVANVLIPKMADANTASGLLGSFQNGSQISGFA